MNEEVIWRKYPINPDYEVSNMGEVRRTKDGKVLKQYPQKSGYVNVWLGNVATALHKIVAFTFLDAPDDWTKVNVVDHINTNRADNRACNLRWASYKENSNNEQTKINMRNARIRAKKKGGLNKKHPARETLGD